MGEPQAGRAWRRRRAWELKEEGWTQKAIAEALGVTAGAVSQWLKRARTEGVEGLVARPRTGRPPRLTAEQRQELVDLLGRGAESHGFRGDVWTCQRVGEVIRRAFGVRYHPAHVGRLLHAVGWTVQQPVKRARQQDPEAVKHWREERWPALEKGSRRGLADPAGSMRPRSTCCQPHPNLGASGPDTDPVLDPGS